MLVVFSSFMVSTQIPVYFTSHNPLLYATAFSSIIAAPVYFTSHNPLLYATAFSSIIAARIICINGVSYIVCCFLRYCSQAETN